MAVSRRIEQMERYDFKAIEQKWQKRWAERNLFRTRQDPNRPKFYYLDMFPYPSGELHMGHMRNYIIGDVISRYHVVKGFNVLHPMGYDAFGLPAENAAIERGVHPAQWTEQCINQMRGQFDMLGISFDWEREVRTCEPSYYKWNQWIFLKLYEKGLAYKKPAPVNWCPSCETTLADEEVRDGECWRCESPVIKKWLDQWFFKTTAYAERLLADIELLEHWPERVRTMQRNWIGKSEGVEFSFKLMGTDISIPVFTTRIDTIFGVTFVVLAPEHPLTQRLAEWSGNYAQFQQFMNRIQQKSMEERMAAEREWEGVYLQAYAEHPLSGQPVPIWTADYVLMEYGTGAIMAVPAHDQRDFEFAKKYGIPIQVVIQPPDGELDPQTMTQAYVEPGIMVNSGSFDGMSSEVAMEAIADYMEREGVGKRAVQWRLRDWLISRQRYWGCPIPIVYCDACGTVPVPEKELPVLLPPNVQITGKGGSPLAKCPEFFNTTCPRCSKPAKRETDTMTTFVDSSWYFLRYTDPNNDKEPFSKEAVNYWMPVDQYVGGIEHAVGHLMYSRFITKVLHDLGYLDFVEPFARLFTQGMIYHESYWCPKCKAYRRPKEVERAVTDGEVKATCLTCGTLTEITLDKMSKSKLNVVTPDEICERYGADTGRLFILFVGPPEQDAEWSDEGVEGPYRFLRRLWETVLLYRDCFDADWRGKLSALVGGASSASGQAGQDAPPTLNERQRAMRRKVHQTVRKVSSDIEGFRFNTAVAAMMELLNELQEFVNESIVHSPESKSPQSLTLDSLVFSEAVEYFLVILHPFAPHITDELWERIGGEGCLFEHEWLPYDEEAAMEEEITIVLQVNGKVRDRLTVPTDIGEEELKQLALSARGVQTYIEGKQIKRVIVVPGRLVNIVV